MSKLNLKRKKCSNFLKYDPTKFSSKVLLSKCMDSAKQKIKNEAISALKAEMKKVIEKKLKLS